MKTKSGFTLIELLITMAVVAILGVIAVPSYRSYLISARQNAAEQALLRIASQMENCYSMNQTYEGCVNDGANNFSGVTSFLDANDIEAHYAVNSGFTRISQNDFIIAISAQGAQAKEVDTDCKNLAIDRLGRKLKYIGNANTPTIDSQAGTTRCWH